MAVRSVSVGKMRFPLDRRYYKGRGAHIWLLADKDGTVKLGMDSFLTENAGFLNYIQLDKKLSVRKGSSMGSFESAKFVSRIYSPVSGKVVGVNNEILKNPRMINRDPYKSWIVSIKPGNLERDLLSKDILNSPAAIKEWIREELRKSDAIGMAVEWLKDRDRKAAKSKKSGKCRSK
jgi:glycine cleavage system H protein